MSNQTMNNLRDIAYRIREMRGILGFSVEYMAKKTKVTPEEYMENESGNVDLPFSFIHNCAVAFGLEITDLLEGTSAHTISYQVTRKGAGARATDTSGKLIENLAPKFKGKLAEPYWVRYEYDENQQDQPIHTDTHPGQEFDMVLSGSLKVQVGDSQVVLNEGDSIIYNSSEPHGMIAVEGKACEFLAFVLPGTEEPEQKVVKQEVKKATINAETTTELLISEFAKPTVDENGYLKDIRFENTERFNFGYDVVDKIAAKYPDKLAMIHLDINKKERRFTFSDISRESNRCANYFISLGIRPGDKVMLVLKRHYQFWIAMVALHKIGAIAIPATFMLKEHDFVYRYDAAQVSTIVCTADGDTADIAEEAAKKCPSVKRKVIVNGKKNGWHNFDKEYIRFKDEFPRWPDTRCGDDIALIFFSSGTTGQPKMVAHAHTYGLGHFLTARYWHCCKPDGLHFTISDTGWGKSLWGKLYGQWMCEGAVFVYDFDKFKAADLLPLFAEYQITTFCAPPTMLRIMIKEDLSKYDMSSVRHMTTAGEALNPEVAKQFLEKTGLEIMEGFGQTETTLTVGNLEGTKVKLGSMGKPSPQYEMVIVDPDGKEVGVGEVGEICCKIDKSYPVGLFKEYYADKEKTDEAIRDGLYHTGDTAWRDEDGYFFFVGRVDDVIKSSGYRIGPFEIESVIMELPYVLECGVSAEPDEVRGQIVKASIVLTKGTEGTEELKKEIQDYVKSHTAPYKYPRKVVFRDSLPKTISGKIQRNEL